MRFSLVNANLARNPQAGSVTLLYTIIFNSGSGKTVAGYIIERVNNITRHIR